MSESLLASREMDALVAEKVMGHRVSWWSIRLVDRPPTDVEWRHGLFTSDASLERMEEGEVLVATADGDMPMQRMFDGEDWVGIPHYSTRIEDAWKVAEKIGGPGFRVDISLAGSGLVDCALWMMDDDSPSNWTCLAEVCDAETAPLAICRAALAARSTESDG